MSYYPFPVGGAEVAIKEITDRLPKGEYEFDLICNRYDSTIPKVEKKGNVNIHRIGLVAAKPDAAALKKLPLHVNKLLYQFNAYRHARRLHKLNPYNGVWAMMAHSCGVPAGLFKRAFPEVRYYLTLQEGDPPEVIEKTMRIFGPLFKQGFVAADVVQSISTFLQNWATRMGSMGKKVVIPNAVDTNHFSQTFSDEEIDAARKELDLTEGVKYLITTSRLVHKNGLDSVIQSLEKLPDNIHFLVFGLGPDEEKLKKLTETLNLKERVHFQGHVDHSKIPAYLAATDIFIRPSRSEGMGNSFVEAMAAQVPVIATQEGGLADFLFDEKRNPDSPTTGWAVDVDDPENIAEAVQDILANPENTRAVCETALQMVVKKYTWDIVAERMHQEVFTDNSGG